MVFRFLLLAAIIILVEEAQAQSWCLVQGQLDDISESLIHHHPSSIRPRAEKWFQVVVHDVSKSQSPISYAQVVHQIDVLNADFAKNGANIHKLREEFEALAADTEIRFCLASTDPFGNPTTGLTYTNTDIDRIALERDIDGRFVVHYDQLGGKTGWDPSRYINIWVADYGGSGILGYGSLPGTAPFPEEIGVVMDRNYFGSIGTATSDNSYNRGHTLSHEMGHFFGLLHIWGDEDMNCTDSDEVEDTPNATGPYTGCPLGRQESCGVSNMYQNFMDFTDDRCLAAFTHGQAKRMMASIDLFYPELAQNTVCRNENQDPVEWWNGLVWSFDSDADKYVLYSNTGFQGLAEIDVFTIDGRRILHDEIVSRQSYLINLNGMAAGIYIVRMKAGQEEFVRKIGVY